MFPALLAAGTAAQVIGGYRQSKASKAAASATDNLNRELAESGIRMRVKDAELAGLSPLAALGLPLSSPSPVQVGDQSGGFMELGQGLHRAAEATMSKDERIGRARLLDAQVTNQELQNQLLLAQIVQQSQVGPSLPSPMDNDPMLIELGQGDGVQLQPAKVTAATRGQPSKEAGAITDYGFARTPTGYTPVPSADVKQRIEDNIIPESLWGMRNLFMPSEDKAPPRKFLPKGATGWRWHFLKQEWQPAYKGQSKYLRDTR